jgi:hypothetical protein
MTSYRVKAELTVEVTDATALSRLGGGGDEQATIQRALDAGIRELPGVAQRYGLKVTDASATVESS